MSTLFRRGFTWSAHVYRNGRAARAPVTAGRTSGTETQVLDDLQEGDEAIPYPGDRVTNGQRVQPIKVML